MIYRTMTVGGMHGSDVEADDDDEAMNTAEHMGYEVLDMIERTDGKIIVIGDGA